MFDSCGYDKHMQFAMKVTKKSKTPATKPAKMKKDKVMKIKKQKKILKKPKPVKIPESEPDEPSEESDIEDEPDFDLGDDKDFDADNESGNKEDDIDNIDDVDEFKSHKESLARLRDTDPEFYKFLQENDKKLLSFNISDNEADDDDDNDDNLHKPSGELEIASDESDFEVTTATLLLTKTNLYFTPSLTTVPPPTNATSPYNF